MLKPLTAFSIGPTKDLPATWNNTDPNLLVRLDPISNEYQDVQKVFLETLHAATAVILEVIKQYKYL